MLSSSVLGVAPHSRKRTAPSTPMQACWPIFIYPWIRSVCCRSLIYYSCIFGRCSNPSLLRSLTSVSKGAESAIARNRCKWPWRLLRTRQQNICKSTKQSITLPQVYKKQKAIARECRSNLLSIEACRCRLVNDLNTSIMRRRPNEKLLPSRSRNLSILSRICPSCGR